jgi:glycine/D-amino acid oxidase-like deaminating enzyme
MGLATAYSITNASDSKVLILDRYGIGNDYCSSNDATKVFRYSYGDDELYTRMAVESLKLWKNLEKESGQELLLPTGLLMLQGEDRDANGFNEASYRTLTRIKLGAEQLGVDELEKRFPQFRAEKGFFDPHGGVLLASKALDTFNSLTRRQGVKVHKGQARRIIFGDSPSIETVAGEAVRFHKLVITIGPWSNSLLNQRMTSMVPTRQQLIYLKPPKGLDLFRPRTCPVFFADKHYGLPAAAIDGVKVSPKELNDPVDPENANRSVDQEQIAVCRDVCRKFVPDLADGEVIHTKVCLYDMTENSDFVLDRDPDHPEVVYGYGFSGHGFKFAPLIGRLLSELALDREPSFPIEKFTADPSRRRAPTTGAHLGKGK